MYYHPSLLDMYSQVRRNDDLREVEQYAMAKQVDNGGTPSARRRWSVRFPALRIPRPAFAKRGTITVGSATSKPYQS